MEKEKPILENLGSAASKVGTTVKNAALASRDAIISAMDENGNGEIDIEDIIIKSMKIPGIRIRRDAFLQRELTKNFPQEVIDAAITTTPAKAKISPEAIDKIADEVIKFERNCVSGISTVLGIPVGAAMIATIPADIAQYYGYMLRAAQKLMYLYGFPELIQDSDGAMLDSETLNVLTICLGVMYGVAGANKALTVMAAALGKGVEKKLLNTALTKGTIYPLVKSIMKWFNVNLTKKVFASFFRKAIPVIGGVVGGGITYLSFKPCCDKLKVSLSDTLLSNPDRGLTDEEEQEIIDLEASAPESGDAQEL